MASRWNERYGIAIAAMTIAAACATGTAAADTGVDIPSVQIERVDPDLDGLTSGELPQPNTNVGAVEEVDSTLGDAEGAATDAGELLSDCTISVHMSRCGGPPTDPSDPRPITASMTGAATAAKITWESPRSFWLRNWRVADTKCDNRYVYAALYADGALVWDDWNMSGCGSTVRFPDVYRQETVIHGAVLRLCTWDRTTAASDCAYGDPVSNPHL